MVAHRRCGKTTACLNDLIRKALTLDKPHGRYAYVAPYYSQAKLVAWDFLKRYSRPVATAINESELKITLLNGGTIRLFGADNADALRGSYLDGVILDEHADMRPGVWGEVVRPMLSDRKGWATFIGTPKGHNAFYEICYGDGKNIKGAANDPGWYFAALRASDTGIMPFEELSDARSTMTQEQYDQEYECSFEAAIQGAYFGKEVAQADRDGRIRSVPYQQDLPVHTAWDIGKGINIAVWLFQIVGAEVHIIDFIEGQHSDGFPEMYERMLAKGYRYGHEWVPHDAKANEFGTGKTRIETMHALTGRWPRLVPMFKVEDGINAARLFFQRCYFDAVRCKDAIEGLRQYRAEYDEKAKVFLNQPKHDWTSHIADAFRYMAIAWKEMNPDAAPKTEQQKLAEAVAKMLAPRTYDDITKDDDEA